MCKKLAFEKRSNGIDTNYIYDDTGVCGMIHNSQYYEFVRNIFGDVIALYNGSTCVAKYSYDAWGKCTVMNADGTVTTSSIHIGNVNPFRYRGYYYDTESGLYYLMSRYYDPEIGQFISPDTFDYLAPETIGGVNLYAYCLNNPVMGYDPTGHWFFTVFSIIVSVVVNVVEEVVEDLQDGKLFNDKDWLDYTGATVGGIVSGFGKSFFAGVGFGILGDTLEKGISGELNSDNFIKELCNATKENFAGAMIGEYAGNIFRKGASYIKAYEIINMKGVVDNNAINRELKRVTNNFKIGSNSATFLNIKSRIYFDNVWKPVKYTGMFISKLF